MAAKVKRWANAMQKSQVLQTPLSHRAAGHSAMRVAASLTAFIAAYSAILFLLPVANAVPPESWMALLALGAISTVCLQLQSRWKVSARSWVRGALYAVLLALLFFGADFSLTVLGTSVKPRASLPSFLNGLELYYLFVPGFASIALGAALGEWLRARQQRQCVDRSSLFLELK